LYGQNRGLNIEKFHVKMMLEDLPGKVLKLTTNDGTQWQVLLVLHLQFQIGKISKI
jgi:hypothetical protein